MKWWEQSYLSNGKLFLNLLNKANVKSEWDISENFSQETINLISSSHVLRSRLYTIKVYARDQFEI